jgi:hypothetical protein
VVVAVMETWKYGLKTMHALFTVLAFVVYWYTKAAVYLTPQI